MQLCRKSIYSSQLTHLGPPNVGHKERAGGFYIAPLPPSTDSSRAAFSFWEGLLLSRCRFWFFTFILPCSHQIASIGSGKHFDKISLLQIKNSLSSLLLRVPVLPHPQRRSTEPNHCLEQLRPLFWCKATRKKKRKKRSPVYPAVTLARV